jgi:hypothetical protein
MEEQGMYHPQHDRGQEQRMHRTEQGHFVRAALRVLTAVFWVAAPIFVVLIAVSAFTNSIGALQSLITGISLLFVVLSSGAITWVEFRSNPLDDAERGEWTNKMLFYGLVFGMTFFVAFLYLPALYFAP